MVLKSLNEWKVLMRDAEKVLTLTKLVTPCVKDYKVDKFRLKKDVVRNRFTGSGRM